jgi:hypothetical protein
MTGSIDASAAGLVEVAIERFSAGDDEGFVACFDPNATIWAEPQLVACFDANAKIWVDPHLAPGVVLSGREQVAAWCREARALWSDVHFSHGELSNQGAGAYVELDVVTASGGAGGAWRLSVAVFVQDGLVHEVLPQPDRDAAICILTTR